MSNKIKKTFIMDNLKHFKQYILPFQKHLCFESIVLKIDACKAPCVRFSNNLFYKNQSQHSHEIMPLCIFKGSNDHKLKK